MAANLEKLAQYHAEMGNQPRANLYLALAAEERANGVPETLASSQQAWKLPEFPTESGLDLDQEWLKQTDRLACLFATALGKSKDEYIDSLPKFFAQPESYRGRFDIPRIVQTPTGKLTLVRMLEIAGITNYLSDVKEIKDWQKDPGKFKTPKMPYITWLSDGSINLGRKVEDIRTGFAPDERGGTVYDGLALVIQNPGLLKEHYLDLPGSQYGSDRVPSLRLAGDEPGLDYRWVGSANPYWGSVVAGRKIVTG